MNAQRVILGFVRRARMSAYGAAAVVTIAVAVAFAAAAWWLALRLVPAQASLVLLIGGAVVLALVGHELLRARLSLATLDAQAHAGDALLTYWPHRAARNQGMAAWLEARLAAHLRAQPAPVTARRRASRSLRRLLPLLPFLLLLLLLCWLLPAGLGDGSRHGIEGAPEPGRDPAVAGAGTDVTKPPSDESAQVDPLSPPRVPPDQPPPDPEAGPGESVSSRPVQLPIREEFVVPSFVGDGPSRPGKAREAEQEVVAGTPPAVSGSGAVADRPPSTPQDFERAAERAATARHVPAAERAIVQRYFKALAERR